MLQGSQREMILDDCPEPYAVIPPFPLLYRGFGHFSDAMATRTAAFSAAIHSGTFSDPECVLVDGVLNAMRGIGNDYQKLHYAKQRLRTILFPGTKVLFEGEQYDYMDDYPGHVTAAHGGPLLMVQFKRQMATVEPQLAAYYLRFAMRAKKQLCRGWRQPALGLIFRGEARCPSLHFSADATEPKGYTRRIYLVRWPCHD
jgi:hypothetical protein